MIEDELPVIVGEQRTGEVECQSNEQQTNGTTARCANVKIICLSLFIGQVLAGLLGASNISLALLAQVNISLPLSQMVPQYALVALVFGMVRFGLMYKQCRTLNSLCASETIEKNSFTTRKLLLCIITGVVDMNSHWATVYAFAYTNVASIQLLDCLAIPTSMFLSFVILRHRYSWSHYVGVLVCIVGSSLMVVADVIGSESKLPKNSTMTNEKSRREVVFGDILAISGAFLYGVSSVLQEYTILNCGTLSCLTIMPLVAAILSAIFGTALERKQLAEIFGRSMIGEKSTPKIAILYFMGYLITMSLLDSVIGFTVTTLSAVLINISLLSTDIYALLAGIGLFHLEFHWLYFIAFTLIIIGSVVFALKDAKPDDGHMTEQ